MGLSQIILAQLLVGFCSGGIIDMAFIKQYRRIRNLVSFEIDIDIDNPAQLEMLRDLGRVQDWLPPETQFPCNLTNARSKVRPSSIHTLRPGDIDVIGAIGDSVSAGVGVLGVDVTDLLAESRGVSFAGGGDKTFREFLTLPNIFKEFNPNLIGYAVGNSMTIDRRSKFNVAELGAVSNEMPYMAKILVKRIMHDPGVDLQNDWKFINFFIGHNDFCLESCYDTPERTLKNHKKDLLLTLRTLRDSLPRTVVNLIPPVGLDLIRDIKYKPKHCEISLKIFCPCMIGLPNINKAAMIDELIKQWQLQDLEVANYAEFRREDFGVITMNQTIGLNFPDKNGISDLSYLSSDCFHPTQKSHAALANTAWNNLFDRGFKGEVALRKVFQKFECPTEELPFIKINN